MQLTKNFDNLVMSLILIMLGTFILSLSNNAVFNVPLIAFMSMSTVLLIAKYRKAYKYEVFFYILYILMLLLSMMHSSFRASSIIYSLLFILTYILYNRIIRKPSFNVMVYKKTVGFLILSYFLVIVFQQLSWLFDIPIFNYNTGELSNLKFNSLASEPSYVGRFLVLLILAYICMREIELGRVYDIRDFRIDRKIWFMFFWTTITSGAASAVILLSVFLVKFLKKRYTPIIILLAFIIIYIVSFYDLNSINRIFRLAEGFWTFDVDHIMGNEESGGFRIAPTILYIKDIFSLFNVDTWIGYGMDSSSHLVSSSFLAANEFDKVQVGLFPYFIMDFGLLCFILLFYIIFKFCIRNFWEFIIFIIILLDAPFNTQLFWFTVVIFSTNKYLYKKNQNQIVVTNANFNNNSHFQR